MQGDFQGRCPVCRDPVAVEPLACAGCLTRYHRDCWDYNEGCAIFACSRRPVPPERPRIPPVTLEAVRRMALAASGGFLIALICMWPTLVRIDPLRCRLENGNLRFSWASSQPVECLLEVARDESFTEIVARTITHRAEWHEVDTRVAPSEVYYYRVRPVTSRWAEMSRWGWIRLPPSAISPPRVEPAAQGEGALACERAVRLANASFAEDFFSSYVHDYDERSGLMDVLWATKEPVHLCRVILSRDASLNGVEKVLDAVSAAGGRYHKISLPMARGTQYRFLILALPSAGGRPIQSAVQDLHIDR